MIPSFILNQLGKLRRREIGIRLAWGLARWLSLALVLLILACLIDWSIDKGEDTPWGVRLVLFGIQVVVWLAAAGFFVVRPFLRSRLGNRDLALLVEDKHPHLEHRLISAVQLNQAGAQTAGMSPELISQVTREAEQEAARISFAQVADHRRLRWSLLVAGPVVLVVLMLLLAMPELALALLARQFLADKDIPHAISLVGVNPAVWPQGEKIALRFRVSGPDIDSAQGEVAVQPDGLPEDRYPLELEKQVGPGEALFVAHIQASLEDFSYRARLGDGRTRKMRLHLVPRPVVTELTAWVVLPEFCDPEGRRRYQKPQARGDIAGIPGSQGRIRVKIQKPVFEVYLELLQVPETEKKPAGEEIVHRKIGMKLNEDQTQAEGTFALGQDETAYRVLAVDEHGFANVPPPRRQVRLVAEDPPVVNLLREHDLFPSPDRLLGRETTSEVDLEGMPVPLGRPFRIGYTCTGPYGLGRVRMLFRVLKKVASGNEEAPEPPWQKLDLVEVKAGPGTGLFLPRFGVFQNSGPRDQVPFFAVLAFDPEHLLGRTVGGGRFNFQTTGILDTRGEPLELREGDQIEYCIEVFADRDPVARPDRPSARSPSRVKTIVSEVQFAQWERELAQEQRRLSNLESEQTKVFSGN